MQEYQNIMDVRIILLAVALIELVYGRRGGRKVCSTAGVEYSNKCEFYKATCKPNDVTYDDVTLKRCSDVMNNKKIKSKSCFFTSNKENVETRQNCEQLKAKCEKTKFPLKLHEGTCGDCSRENLCPWEQKKSAFGQRKRKPRRSFKRPNIGKLRVCTENGDEFTSICDYHVAKCQKYNEDKTILKKRRCSDKGKKKERKGKRETGEVCSSDGQKYSNRCALLAATCKPEDKSFDFVTIARCNGPIVKTKEPNICVLSDDEKSVTTMQHCMYLKAKCEDKPLPKRFYSGECGDCSKDNLCPYEKRKKANPGMKEQRKKRWRRRPRFSICASDATSYKSVCDFHVAKCEKFKEDGTILKIVKTNRRRGSRGCKGKKTATQEEEEE